MPEQIKTAMASRLRGNHAPGNFFPLFIHRSNKLV